jgi:hypothetical protein
MHRFQENETAVLWRPYSTDFTVRTVAKGKQFVQQGTARISRRGTIFEGHLMHRKEGTANTKKRHDFLGVPYSIYCCSSRTVVQISGTDFEELHSRIFLKKTSINSLR